MSNLIVQPEDLGDVDFSKSRLMLALLVPGSEREDATCLDVAALRALHSSLTDLQSAGPGVWRTPPATRHPSLAALAAWAEAAVTWAEARLQ